MTALPTLLVIGGGFGGIGVAKALKGVADVTVVDRKDYFDVNIANVRAVVDPVVAAKNNFLYKDVKGLGRFVQGSVVKLDQNSATLQDGQTIKFDYCVISVGSSYGASWAKGQVTSLTARRAELEAEYQKIKAAKSIVIAGGGPVAVEVAAEILEAFAGKKVTVVTPGSILLEEKPKLASNALKWLQSHGATVVFNDRVDEFPDAFPAVVRTKTGKELPADYLLKCFGTRVNTDWLKGQWDSVLDARGAIKVDDFLQVVGRPNVWAIGDCNSVAETKLAYYAMQQAALTAKNIGAVIKGRKLTAYKPYNGTPAMFVSLGRGSGTGAMGGCVCPSFLVASMKSKHLFVDQTRGEMLG